jgi:predicted dehydrogenase
VTRADDVDLVLVLTPNDSHAEVSLDALGHGKHVLCEKPLAHTLAAARAIYEVDEVTDMLVEFAGGVTGTLLIF